MMSSESNHSREDQHGVVVVGIYSSAKDDPAVAGSEASARAFVEYVKDFELHNKNNKAFSRYRLNGFICAQTALTEEQLLHEIAKRVEALQKTCGTNSVLFYYSGHAYNDGTSDWPSFRVRDQGAVRMDDLEGYLEAHGVQLRVVIYDGCNSGNSPLAKGGRGGGGGPRGMKRFTVFEYLLNETQGRILLSSAAKGHDATGEIWGWLRDLFNSEVQKDEQPSTLGSNYFHLVRDRRRPGECQVELGPRFDKTRKLRSGGSHSTIEPPRFRRVIAEAPEVAEAEEEGEAEEGDVDEVAPDDSDADPEEDPAADDSADAEASDFVNGAIGLGIIAATGWGVVKIAKHILGS